VRLPKAVLRQARTGRLHVLVRVITRQRHGRAVVKTLDLTLKGARR
jgi:hypothetical protein